MRTTAYIIRYIFGMLAAGLLSGCIHEFPEPPEKVLFHLKLHYETDLPQWEYPITAARTSVPSKSVQTAGEMRYVIRFYSRSSLSRSAALKEFVFTRAVADGYDASFDLEVPAGDYTVKVWSDLAEHPLTGYRFYDASDFSHIVLQGDYAGNNDYRDAFRGTHDLTLTADIVEKEPETVEVEMVRPLAKFEFVTTDVEAFVEKEIQAALSRGELSEDHVPSRVIDVSQYKVMFYYFGFMPNTFNMFTDKPSDSATGVRFEGGITQLNDQEASLGFDYVFVNGKESTVTVQVAIYDKEDRQLSMSEPINVPLRRSKHTLLKGEFLMQETSGGVGINPSFGGDFDIVLKN